MTKRVQVLLSDEEYDALAALAELRGESMSRIIAQEIEGFNLLLAWRQEVNARRHHFERDAKLKAALDERVARVRAKL